MNNVWGPAGEHLEPGEGLVKILRGELTIPPDHMAIARAKAAMRAYPVRPIDLRVRDRAPLTAHQRECLDG